eukprot:3353547-Amphidinium_carterae.1
MLVYNFHPKQSPRCFALKCASQNRTTTRECQVFERQQDSSEHQLKQFGVSAVALDTQSRVMTGIAHFAAGIKPWLAG